MKKLNDGKIAVRLPSQLIERGFQGVSFQDEVL
jgi:hypothetical protein